MPKKIYIAALLISIIMTMTACGKGSQPYAFEDVKNGKFDHLHGIGYSNGGPGFVIATHAGLYQYAGGQWKEANHEKHDYMGFSATRDGFFSSGHPEPGSDLKNPLGLIKSVDRGGSVETLAFYGQLDFHYMAAGYDSNEVFVVNETPIKELPAGLEYTTDEGATWESASMNGFTSDTISNVAAHPSDKGMLAIGSKDGIFISRDYGENFERMPETGSVLYVFLTEAGGVFSSYEQEKVQLKRFSSGSGQIEELSLPSEQMSPIVMLAVHPDDGQEMVIATYDNDIYMTEDGGENWSIVAEKGNLK